jgi:hypothetical protein
MSNKISLALMAVLVACVAAQHTLLLLSNPSTTTLVSPAGQSIGLEPYHNLNTANKLGNGAQWVWVAGSDRWPDQYAATFQALFYVDCPEVGGDLRITADNIFVAYLNGVKVG